MESSEDDKDGASRNGMPRELSLCLANGTKFVDEVLKAPSERCLDNFRMDKDVFYKLCDKLQGKGLLRHTNRIKIEEQLAIFLFIIGHKMRTRAVQELFRYSGETISRHFNNVLNAIMSISLGLFQPPSSDVPAEIKDDPRFYPYFKDCVGVVDGVHFPVTVGLDEQGPFRNKDGVLTQNVLAAFSFDLKFHYVLAGWEGSASDLQILNSAITRRNKLQVPEGKYYLVGRNYANIPGFLAPYEEIPYNLHENFITGYHPEDIRKMFNQRHSLLRNTSARMFGALKERFPILTSAPPYPLQTQVKLVIAACALHNFVLNEKPDDLIVKVYKEDNAVETEELPPLDAEQTSVQVDNQAFDMGFTAEELGCSLQQRDAIAGNIWEDCIQDFSTL